MVMSGDLVLDGDASVGLVGDDPADVDLGGVEALVAWSPSARMRSCSSNW
jgi:hypothetical protein